MKDTFISSGTLYLKNKTIRWNWIPCDRLGSHYDKFSQLPLSKCSSNRHIYMNTLRQHFLFTNNPAQINCHVDVKCKYTRCLYKSLSGITKKKTTTTVNNVMQVHQCWVLALFIEEKLMLNTKQKRLKKIKLNINILILNKQRFPKYIRSRQTALI